MYMYVPFSLRLLSNTILRKYYLKVGLRAIEDSHTLSNELQKKVDDEMDKILSVSCPPSLMQPSIDCV